MTALVATEAVVLLLLTLLVAGLLRSHAQILRALHSLGIDLGDLERGAKRGSRDVSVRIGPPPDAAPERTSAPGRDGNSRGTNVTGTAPDGSVLSISVIGARTDTLLAFLSSGCASCASFWETFNEDADLCLPEGVRLVAVTLAPGAESPARIRKLAPPTVPVVMSDDAWADYQVPGSPYFVYVRGADGSIAGEGSAPTWSDVRSLLGDALADQRERWSATARTRWSSGDQREARADRALEQAGILPGDPRLYPSSSASD